MFRDHAGDVMVCAAGFLPNILNALHSEMLAAESALHLASDLGMGRVYLETDALLLKMLLMTMALISLIWALWPVV